MNISKLFDYYPLLYYILYKISTTTIVSIITIKIQTNTNKKLHKKLFL